MTALAALAGMLVSATIGVVAGAALVVLVALYRFERYL